MRYILIDRFLELEAGARARAVKCVTRGESFLGENGLDEYPAALVLEGLLQTGGVLARAGRGAGARSVLGKVERAEFPGTARPGDRLELDVKAILSRPEGTLCEGVARVDEQVVGRAEFMIVFVPPELAPPEDPAVEAQRQLLKRALAVPGEEA